MITIQKKELQKAQVKVQALQSQQDRIFTELVESLGLKTELEKDYVFDLIFNDMDYSGHSSFNELFEIKE